MAIQFAQGTPTAHSFKLLPKGNYPFEVLDAKEKALDKDGAKLKKGTQFIELKIKVNDEVTIFDNLFFDASTFWKIDAFLKSIGMHTGDGEVITIDCFDLCGEKGFADLKVGKNGRGEDRNEIGGYTWEA